MLEITRYLAVALLVCWATCAAGSDTVWQIGVFDEASIEFKKQINYADPSEDPIFVVGKSTPENDWPAYQPGSANGHAGHRRHPFTIQFELPERPFTAYLLRVALIVDTPRLPHLQVEINGGKAWFYPQPRLNYRMGDPIGNSPTYAAATLAIHLPSKFLRKGENRLVLTAIDEPEDRDDAVAPPGRLGDSGLFYDAVALIRDGSVKESSSELTAAVIPTIFYQTQGTALVEIVQVRIGFGERPTNARIALTKSGFAISQEMRTDRDFGEHQVEVKIPESHVAGKWEVLVSLPGARSKKFLAELAPAKKWTLFVVPHEHLDIGYSDYQAKTYEVQSRAIDQAIDTMEKHASFRYTLDGQWAAEQFMNTRALKQRTKFLNLIREGKIGVPANYFNLLTGFASSEELIRSFYAAKKFHDEYGLPFEYASITDVPSYSWSYASVLSAVGLRYLVAASNNERAPMLRLGGLNRRSPFLWQGPDGSTIRMWYSQSYQQMPHIFGLPPSMVGGRDTLPIFLQQYDDSNYKSDGAIVYGTQWENTALYTGQAKLDEEWNKQYTYPRIRFSGFVEAMQYITAQQGIDMPMIRGDGGPYWEDGIGSDAYFVGIARENQHRALTAEKFATVSALVNPETMPDHETLDAIWKNQLLFAEHCWEADRSIVDPVSQLSIQQRGVKEARVLEGRRLIDETVQRSMSIIADSTENPSHTVMVFNSLNWSRSSLVEMDLDKNTALVDLSSGENVPYEILSSGNGFVRIRFWAKDVPAVGYKSYSLRRPGTTAVATTGIPSPILENQYYRIELEPESGAIQSIFDKELQREVVDSSSTYRFNEYLYVTGGDGGSNRLSRYSEVLPPPELKVRPANSGKLISVTKTPFGTVARVSNSGVNTPHIETEIVLLDNQKAVLFTNHLTKTKTYAKEGVYFAFPFASQKPEFRYETQNGFVNPEVDLLPGAGREWFSVQHWVQLRENDWTAALVPIDAPVVTFEDIVRGAFPRKFGKRSGTVFSWVMNNYWTTNYVAGQGGDFVFRYALTSGRQLTPAALSRFGWELMSKLEVNEIIPQDRVDTQPRPLSGAQDSFLQIDSANVVLTAWKPAEDGSGSILRLTELNGEGSEIRLRSPIAQIQSAWSCDAVERCHQPLTISAGTLAIPIKPFQILTVKIQMQESER